MSRFWVFGLVAMVAAGPIHAGETIAPFVMGLAQASSSDSEISAFYRENAYEAVWTDPQDDDRARLTALLAAFDGSEMHALPRGELFSGRRHPPARRCPTEGDRAQCRVRAERTVSRIRTCSAVWRPGSIGAAAGDRAQPSAPRGGTDLLQPLSEEPAAKSCARCRLPQPNTHTCARARAPDRRHSVGGWGQEVSGRSL